MTIDVIHYTEEQYAQLNSEQLLEVRKVQTSKNRLLRRLEEEKLSEKYRLVKAGIFRSEIWENICARLQSAYDAEVEMLRDGLLFYLQYSGQQQNAGAGYTVDYSLSIVDRTVLVKEYYIRTYSDVNQRFEAFKNDQLAPSYLCEAYSSLYQWFLYDVQNPQ
jgi:hypothetical protein